MEVWCCFGACGGMRGLYAFVLFGEECGGMRGCMRLLCQEMVVFGTRGQGVGHRDCMQFAGFRCWHSGVCVAVVVILCGWSRVRPTPDARHLPSAVAAFGQSHLVLLVVHLFAACEFHSEGFGFA